jgi:hypothetical protein
MNNITKYNYYKNVNNTYEDHLLELLKVPFYKKFVSIYEKIEEDKSIPTKKKFIMFQKQMNHIKNWDNQELLKSTDYVVKQSKSNYIINLFKSVIISHINLLILSASRKKKFSIEKEIPDTIIFFHRCFIEIGKSFYKDPYVICKMSQQPGERLRNITSALYLIELSIKRVINSFLPYNQILEIYLANVEKDMDSSDDEEESEDVNEESEIEDINSEDIQEDDVKSEASDVSNTSSLHNEKIPEDLNLYPDKTTEINEDNKNIIPQVNLENVTPVEPVKEKTPEIKQIHMNLSKPLNDNPSDQTIQNNEDVVFFNDAQDIN